MSLGASLFTRGWTPNSGIDLFYKGWYSEPSGEDAVTGSWNGKHPFLNRDRQKKQLRNDDMDVILSIVHFLNSV